MLPRVGISSCLLGERVRYDGGHKLQQPLLARLKGRVQWVAVCPEAELGLGVPRETIALERVAGDVRLVATGTRRDLTDSMQAWADTRVQEFGGLCGFVLKARSPSCGLRSAPVIGAAAPQDGLWAASVRARLPWLPLADEAQVAAAEAAEHFLFQAEECLRLNRLFVPSWQARDLVDFHTRSKLLLLAYSPDAYRTLGRLVAKPEPSPSFEAAYRIQYMAALREQPTPGRESNALAHAFGYFSEQLPVPERQALAAQVEAVARGQAAPSAVKAQLLAHARRLGFDYLVQQRYLA